LRLHVERTDGLHLVAEKVDTVGKLVGERENVEDTAPEGVLPRLIKKLHTNLDSTPVRKPVCGPNAIPVIMTSAVPA
jgi:hypothetical protein